MKDIPVRKIKSKQIAPNDITGQLHVKQIDSNGMDQRIHRHDFYYMLIINKGEGKHTIDFKSYEVNHQSIFVLRPGQVHELMLKPGVSGYMIQFSSDFYTPYTEVSQILWRNVKYKTVHQPGAEAFQCLYEMSTIIYREFTGRKTGCIEVIKAALEMLLIQLGRSNTEPGDQLSEISYAQDYLDQFLNLLDANIRTHKRASYYAAALHLSVYQLNAILRKTIDSTTSDAINERIILEAKRYLMATSDQITEIAYFLGYSDVSYFIRFFKKRVGMSPEVFRNMSKSTT